MTLRTKTALHNLGWLFLLFVLAAESAAQVLPFEHYTTKDGLPSNWITAMEQDSGGYLWIGSNEGLAVFDGVQFRSYSVVDGLPVNQVWALAASQASPGVMWIGTQDGVARFERGRFTSFRLDATGSADGNSVHDLIEDRAGTLWCGTYAGVYMVQQGRARLIPIDNQTGAVSFIHPISDSLLLVGIDAHVYRYLPQQRQAQRLLTIRHFSEPAFGMTQDERGDIWIVARDSTVYHIRDREIVAARRLSFGASRLGGLSVIVDQYGYLWISTGDGIGFIHRDDFAEGEIIRYTTENGLLENTIACSRRDREDNLWFGGFSKGLCKLAERASFDFPLTDLRPSAMNRAAAVDSAGHFFVASGAGLWEIWKNPGDKWEKYLHRLERPELPGRIYSVDFARDGSLWVCFAQGGLREYRVTRHLRQPSTLTAGRTLAAGSELPQAILLGFIIDRNNHLWCSLMNAGVVQVDLSSGRVRAMHTVATGLPDATVLAIHQDRDGNLWFGGFEQGLSVFAPEGDGYRLQRKLTTADGLPDNFIRALLQHSNGEMWIGTRFHGIAILSANGCETISTKDGLLGNAVNCFVEDHSGRMWLGTSQGIQYTKSATARELVTPERMRGRQIGTLGKWPATSGVWALTWEGLTLYAPERDDLAPAPPPIHLTGLRVKGRAVVLQNGLRFSHDENVCEIHFAGISFREAGAVQYRYRLIGADTEWQGPTKQRQVTYATLRPGTYTFEVVALNAAGVVSRAPARLVFTIVPPLWRRWWFLGLAAAGLSGLVVLLVRLRVRRLLEIEKIRGRIATDLHDDIGAGLTHIGLLSEIALRQYRARPAPEAGGNPSPAAPDSIENAISRMGTVARELSTEMSDVVWSINPKHDSLEALWHRLRNFANEICKAKNIALTFEVDPTIARLKLNPELRRGLLLIAKEALTNMAKYSGSASAAVRLQLEGKALVVVVEDCGRGFASTRLGQGRGNGLTNMRSRAEKLHGTCAITSAIGRGTRVVARIPLP
ncbi:histidine kinase [bacterium]|nr:histidine kinase [bacterium]